MKRTDLDLGGVVLLGRGLRLGLHLAHAAHRLVLEGELPRDAERLLVLRVVQNVVVLQTCFK